jgi:hypothetical protein
VRDKNGEIELGDPPTPALDDPEEVELHAKQDREKERQRLAEAVKQHQIDQNSVPSQPEGMKSIPCCEETFANSWLAQNSSRL